jgi:hypothetical protein
MIRVVWFDSLENAWACHPPQRLEFNDDSCILTLLRLHVSLLIAIQAVNRRRALGVLSYHEPWTNLSFHFPEVVNRRNRIVYWTLRLLFFSLFRICWDGGTGLFVKGHRGISFISKVVNWEESEAWRFFLFLLHSCEFGEPDQVWEGYFLFNSEVVNGRNLSECWCVLVVLWCHEPWTIFLFHLSIVVNWGKWGLWKLLSRTLTLLHLLRVVSGWAWTHN